MQTLQALTQFCDAISKIITFLFNESITGLSITNAGTVLNIYSYDHKSLFDKLFIST